MFFSSVEVLVAFVLIGLFLLAAYVLPFLSNRRCPDCNKRIASQAKACGACGWTSRAVDPNNALSICIFSLNEAFNRKLIDSEALERGKQVVEKLETEYAKFENGRFVYKIQRSPMCEYMINFIHKLKHLPEKYMMNSVLENFTILQVR